MTSRCADRNQRKRPRSSENKERPAAMGTAEDERGENLDSALFGSDSDSGGAEQEAKKEGVSTEPARATEGTPGATEEEGMEDLFGGDDSDSGEDGGGAKGGALDSDEDEDDGEETPDSDSDPSDYDVVAEKEVDTLGTALGKETVLAKLSNIVGVEKRRYDPKEPSGDADHKEQFVVRWRVSADGKVESNARLVKWSDGSRTLQVGDEHLDVLQQDLKDVNVFAFARHEDSELMEGCFDLSKRFTFRPTSVRSKAHALASKEKKWLAVKKESAVARKMITLTENPEETYAKQMKLEEDKIKQFERMQKKQEKEMAKYGLSSSAYARDSYFGRELSAGYLEGSDEEEVPEWDAGATRRAREELSRGRHMGDSRGEKRILSAKEGEEEQTIKRQKFAMGLDESSEEDLAEEKEKEEEEKRGVKRGKAILMSDDED